MDLQLIPIDCVCVCVVSLLVYLKERKKNMYKSIDWHALYNKYIIKCKRNVSKRLNSTSRVLMHINHSNTHTIQRSYIVHVATTNDNKKIYMHKHNM